MCRVYKPKAALPQNKRVVWAYNHSVTVGVLPVSMFANGHIFFVQKLYEVCVVMHFLLIVPLATHASLIIDPEDILRACSDDKFQQHKPSGCA